MQIISKAAEFTEFELNLGQMIPNKVIEAFFLILIFSDFMLIFPKNHEVKNYLYTKTIIISMNYPYLFCYG